MSTILNIALRWFSVRIQSWMFALLQPTKANHRRRNKSIMAWAAEL